MQVFTIHQRPNALTPDRDAVVIKEGFCWTAFFFSPFWALAHRMWFVSIGIFALLILMAIVETALRVDPATYSVITLGVAAIIGFGGNDWRRAALATRGWQMQGLSAAPDRDAALRRFFDLHPEAAGLTSPSPGF